jgi:hypothetical protein
LSVEQSALTRLSEASFTTINSAGALDKIRDFPNGVLHMLDSDKSRALELTRRVLVARTPCEVLVVEAKLRVVPAAYAPGEGHLFAEAVT